MRSIVRRATRVGLVVTTVLSIAACGGTTASGPSGALPTGATGTSAPSGPPSVAPAPSATAASGTTSEPSTAVAIPSFDLGQLGGAIPGLDSYRVAVTTDGTKQYESVVVTKPELAKHITTFDDDGTIDDEFIIIGKDVWEKDDGKWEAVPSQAATAMLMFLDPSVLFSVYARVDWMSGATNVGSEVKNGIPSRHYSIDPAVIATYGAPAGTTADVWVADTGHLVAVEIVSDGTMSLGVEISNVNDPANVVEAPGS